MHLVRLHGGRLAWVEYSWLRDAHGSRHGTLTHIHGDRRGIHGGCRGRGRSGKSRRSDHRARHSSWSSDIGWSDGSRLGWLGPCLLLRLIDRSSLVLWDGLV